MQKHAAKFNIQQGILCKNKIVEMKKICHLKKI